MIMTDSATEILTSADGREWLVPVTPPGANLPPPRNHFTALASQGQDTAPKDGLAALADDLARLGVPLDRIKAAASASGHEYKGPDNRSDEEKAFDGAWSAPSSADGYKVNYVGRSGNVPEADLIAFDGEMKGWLHSLGLPSDLGAHIAETALDVGQTLDRMTPPAHAAWLKQQEAILERVAGSEEAAKEYRELAAGVIKRGKAGFVAEGIARGGALEDAGLIVQLARFAKRSSGKK
jgi:hypothetical protein